MSKIFRLGGAANNATPQQSQRSNNKQSRFELDKIKQNDFVRIGMSALLASSVYFIILSFMPDFAEPWHRHGSALVLSVVFFGFVGFAQKEPGTLGSAILTCLAFIFLLQMAISYL